MDSESGFTTGTICIARLSSNKDSRTFSSTPPKQPPRAAGKETAANAIFHERK